MKRVSAPRARSPALKAAAPAPVTMTGTNYRPLSNTARFVNSFFSPLFGKEKQGIWGQFLREIPLRCGAESNDSDLHCVSGIDPGLSEVLTASRPRFENRISLDDEISLTPLDCHFFFAPMWLIALKKNGLTLLFSQLSSVKHNLEEQP
ncbi:MAG: hypothetical protein ACOC24_00280 [Desulfovibrionales bacterium]